MVDLLELTLISLFSLHGVCRSWLQNLLVVIVPLLKVSVKRGDYVVPLNNFIFLDALASLAFKLSLSE